MVPLTSDGDGDDSCYGDGADGDCSGGGDDVGGEDDETILW